MAKIGRQIRATMHVWKTKASLSAVAAAAVPADRAQHRVTRGEQWTSIVVLPENARR
jgi:hypothetical protein